MSRVRGRERLAVPRRTAQRTCLGCRKTGDRDLLVRYVTAPGGELLVDYRGKLPGRGAYTCMDPDCVGEAVRRRAFERAFRGTLSGTPTGEELKADLAAQIRSRVIALLGMARKAGMTTSGSNLVLKVLDGRDRMGLVLIADDISPGIAGKIDSKADARGIPCFRLLDKGLIGQVLGKGERSVVALQESSLAELIQSEILRYKKLAGES